MAQTRCSKNSNLFNKYNAGQGIKYEILCCLCEHEIHSIMSNVDQEWYKLCKSTFYNSKFKYKFEHYFDKLLNNPFTYINTKILVQCPWNYLWTYGTISSITSKGMCVTVTTKEYHPFEAKFMDTAKRKQQEQLNVIFKNPIEQESNVKSNKSRINELKSAGVSKEQDVQMCHTLYFGRLTVGNSDNDGKGDKKTDESSINNEKKVRANDTTDATDTVDLEENTGEDAGEKDACANLTYFGSDDYHHIAPLNTIDKHKPENKYFQFKQKMHQLTKTIDIDYFDRSLVDINVLAFFTPNGLQLWNGQGNNGVEMVMTWNHPSKSEGEWLCAIIDTVTLNLLCPNWCTDSSDIAKYNYQIPVLFCWILDGVMDHKYYCRYFINYFRYGQNLGFTRIWIDPNDDNLIAPFGTKSDLDSQATILAIPISIQRQLQSKNGKFKEIYADAFKFDFIDVSRLTYKELFDTSIDYDEAVNEKHLELKYGQLLEYYPNKMTVGISFEGSLHGQFFIHRKNVHKQYDFYHIFDASIYDSTDREKHNQDESSHYNINTSVNNINCNSTNDIDLAKFTDIMIKDPNKLNAKTWDYFRPYLVDWRPNITFNIVSFWDQLNSDHINVCDEYKRYYEAVFEQLRDAAEINSRTNYGREKNKIVKTVLVDVKPTHLYVADKNWDSKWSVNLKEKCNGYIDISEFGDECVSLKFDEWKVGFIPFIEHDEDFFDLLADGRGPIDVFFDITDEFDKFQDIVKQDWINANVDKKLKWNNRKYFMEYTFYNKIENKIFICYSVHLDDTRQVAPFQTHTICPIAVNDQSDDNSENM